MFASVVALVLGYLVATRGLATALLPLAFVTAVFLVINLKWAIATSILLVLVVPHTAFLGIPQLGVPRVALLLPLTALFVSPVFRPKLAWADAALVGFLVFIPLSALINGSSLNLILPTYVSLGFYFVGRLIGVRQIARLVLWTIAVAASIGALTVIYEARYGELMFTDPSNYYWTTQDVGGFRPGGVYTSPPGASLMLAMAAPPMLALAVLSHGTRRALVVAGLAIVVAAVALTLTRGGYLALVVGCVGFCLLVFRGRARRRFILGASVIVATAALFLVPTWSDMAWFQESVTRDGTFEAREGYWRLALPLIGDSPATLSFGHGYNAFLLARPESGSHAIPGTAGVAQDLISYGTHNQFINTLLETGVIGFVLLFTWLIAPVVKGIKNTRQKSDPWSAVTSAAFAMSIVAFLVMCFVGDQLRYVPGVAFVALLAGVLQSLAGDSAKARAGTPASTRGDAWPRHATP